jgi:hypothetical protein
LEVLEEEVRMDPSWSIKLVTPTQEEQQEPGTAIRQNGGELVEKKEK